MSVTASASLNAHPGAPFPKRWRPYYPRKKTGCTNCRKRRKRCDEVMPECNACRRNHLECSWTSPWVDAARAERSTSSGSWGCSEPDFHPSPNDDVVTPSSTTTETPDNESLTPRPSQEADLAPFVESQLPLQHRRSSTATELTQATLASLNGRLLLSETRSLSQLPVTLLLTPASMDLLSHYVVSGCHDFTSRPPWSTALITRVIPHVFSDDLLMHVVLALAGNHFNFRNEGPLEIRRATSVHYGMALKGLRRELQGNATSSVPGIMRCALVLILLCCHDAVEGKSFGTIFYHLRACRQLLLLSARSHPDHDATADDVALRNFVLEAYAYLAIVSNITPYRAYGPRTIPLDSFVTSLQDLKKQDTFGAFFSGCHCFFELIPAVALFGESRLAEDELNRCSDESTTEFRRLWQNITTCKPSPLDPQLADWKAEYDAFAETWRCALMIYLKTSMCGSVVRSPKTICDIQHHIDEIWPVQRMVSDSPFGSALLWPTMILGSCLIQEEQRRQLNGNMENPTRWRVTQVVQAGRLLKMLWESQDDRAYGPYGLAFIMEKHNLNFSMS